MRTFIAVWAAALIAGSGAVAVAKPSADAYAAALADAKRPAADKERDARSKPAEILAFAGVKPGDKVADLMIGGGYYSRVFAAAVGPTGSVYAWQPAEFIRFMADYAKPVAELPSAWPNVATSDAAMAELALPQGLDLVFTNQNYHDFHLQPFPADTAAKVNAKVFQALKPGGAYVIIDHHAKPGAGLGVAHTLHRIDIEDVKREVTQAGFVLEAESDLMRAPADPRDKSVFDESIRGRTDQFILKFRKPR